MNTKAPLEHPEKPRYLTFEAGRHLFAVSTAVVSIVMPPGRALPEGTNVIDIVGLLAAGERRAERGCFVILGGGAPAAPPVALTATRALEVVTFDPSALLPLPGFLFSATNPFHGLLPPGTCAGAMSGRAVFVLGRPEAILAAAGAA